MNLINEQVLHHVFGEGKVVSVADERITIQFAEKIGKKMFSYPAVFEQYLKMCDSKAQEFVLEELKIKQNEIAEEQARQEQEQLEEYNRLAAEKAEEKKVKKPRATKKK